MHTYFSVAPLYSALQVVLSDGRHFLYGECAPELNSMIHDHVISQNAIIRIMQFAMLSTRGDRKVCYVVDAQRAAPNPGVFFGSPTDISLREEYDSRSASSGASVNSSSASRLSNTVGPTTPTRHYQAPADAFFSQRSVPRWQDSYRDSTARRAMIDNL